jgi:hypothetical protein
MEIFLLTLVVMLLAVGGMALGVLMGRQPIKGSCGGMSALAGGGTCAVCGDDPAKCTEKSGDRKTDGTGAGVQVFDPSASRDAGR